MNGEISTSRVRVFDVDIDVLTLRQAAEQARAWIDAPTRTAHFSSGVNLHQLTLMRDDPVVDRVIRNSDQVTADGKPIVWASRGRLPERVAAIDVMFELLEIMRNRSLRVFLLGAIEESLQRACRELVRLYPLLEIVGARDGYYSDTEVPALVEDIEVTRPDALFVAISSPKREILFDRYGTSLTVPFIIGVGGAFDILAGITTRSPKLLQKFGLELMWRIIQEPTRMAPRIVAASVFLTKYMIRRASLYRSVPRT